MYRFFALGCPPNDSGAELAGVGAHEPIDVEIPEGSATVAVASQPALSRKATLFENPLRCGVLCHHERVNPV